MEKSNNTKGNLFIVSAPSGAGKTSLVQATVKSLGNIKESISYTTRPQREGEIANKSYFFVDDKTFQEMTARNAFLETAEVYGHFYGTSKEQVETELAKGNDFILTIDWQGAQSIRKVMSEAISIFILPPSLAELRKRLELRHSEGPEDIKRRLSKAGEETTHCHEFDYIVINDDFDTAVDEIKSIISVSHLIKEQQLHKHAAMIEELTNG